MMKRSYLKIIGICLLALFIVFSPLDVKATTLGSLKSDLATLKEKKAAQDSAAKKTQSEINANKAKVKSTEKEIDEARSEVSTIEEQISVTEEEIKELEELTSNILILYQQLSTENIYISYITGASSMTDLVMRLDVINQLTDYNKEKINELELLIQTNEKLSVQLEEYQAKLNTKILAYESAIDELGDELAEYEEGALTYAEQITALENDIKYYTNLGCKDNEDVSACASYVNNSGWLKPVTKGRITSLFGYRSSPTAGASSYHRGIDIGVSEGTTVYGTAAGVVAAIYYKKSCGGNMVYVYTTVNGVDYTYVYMHLLSISVSVGDSVTVNTVIGYSGGGSTASRNGGYDTCTTGAHLHYGLALGHSVTKFNSNAINPPGFPGLYQWFYSR